MQKGVINMSDIALAKLHPWWIEQEVIDFLKKRYKVEMDENHQMLYVYKR
jgi:hypothetical protein